VVKQTLLASALLLLSNGCTKDSYVLGALCAAPPCAGAGGSATSGGATAGSAALAGSGGTAGSGARPPRGFELDLTGSGVERLPEQLVGLSPSHFLIASDATSTAWPARVGDGFEVAEAAVLELALPSPFADRGPVLRHSGAPAFSASSSWADTGGGALAFELVFRGEPGALLLSQRNASAGLELALTADGQLRLSLTAGAEEVTLSSLPLVPDAWHHCLALLEPAQNAGQIVCNGQGGPVRNVPTRFAIAPLSTPATLGGASAARVTWAELARWQAPSWGPRGAWLDLARERFTRLVGTYAEGAAEPLPFAEVRASGAYVDMTPADAPEQRQLHPVGAHWPRIVCRPTKGSARTCGLLVEAASSQAVAPGSLLLENWAATELALDARAAAGPTGASTLYAATPSAIHGAHALELSVPLAEGPAVLSFFARPGTRHRVRAEVAGVASAIFDLGEPGVLEATGTLVSAAEPWGDGLVRASYSFDVEAGPGVVRLSLLADDGSEAFSGDGTVGVFWGDAELRFRAFAAPLPTLAAIQPADIWSTQPATATWRVAPGSISAPRFGCRTRPCLPTPRS
jgi:hypothetical protein